GHRDARFAQRFGRRLREGSDPGHAEDDARQPGESGAAARHDGTHPELQSPELLNRRGAVQDVVMESFTAARRARREFSGFFSAVSVVDGFVTGSEGHPASTFFTGAAGSGCGCRIRASVLASVPTAGSPDPGAMTCT